METPLFTVVERVNKGGAAGSAAGYGWAATVKLEDGRLARVTLDRGNRVRVAYKPRGFVGFKWFGRVLIEGRTLWDGECSKSMGVAGMLETAGLIKRHRCPGWDPTRDYRCNALIAATKSLCKNCAFNKKLAEQRAAESVRP